MLGAFYDFTLIVKSLFYYSCVQNHIGGDLFIARTLPATNDGSNVHIGV